MTLASPFCVECLDLMAAERGDSEEEERAERLARRIAASGIPRHMAEWTIRSYPHGDRRGKAAYQAAKLWLAAYDEGLRHNLYLHGPVGTGKTGLAVSIVRRLCETPGISAYFLVWREWLADVRRSYSTDQPTPERVWKAPVLALDDLGAERPTEWALEELAGVIQRRRDLDIPTVVTSNYSPADLVKRLGGDLAADRIMDRLLDGAIVHEIPGKSRRKRPSD